MRRARLADRDPESGAGTGTPRTVAGHVVLVTEDTAGNVVLQVQPPHVTATSLGVADGTLRGTVRAAAPHPRELVWTRGDRRGAASLVPVDGTTDELAFELRLPDAHASAPHTRVVAALPDGTTTPVAWPEGVADAWLGAGPAATSAAHRTTSGNVEIHDVEGWAELDDLELDGADVRVRGRWLGRPVPDAVLVLRGRRAGLASGALVAAETAEGAFTATVRLTWDEWGLGETPVPLGVFHLAIRAPGDEEDESPAPVTLSPDLLARMPYELRSTTYRMGVVRGPSNRVQLRLRRPLDLADTGPRAQHLLQERHRSTQPPLDDRAVYFQSYNGNAATDSQLAIHEELRRTRPDLTLYWGVANTATRLPEGAVPLVLTSAAWYDVLASARFLVLNVDLPRWFERKPGQRVLQTFHGYPAKSMGIGMWRAKQFTERRIRSELARTSGDWTLILTPTPEMDEHYRREYAYEGAILSHGYPRDDVLVSDRADEVRARTRRLLGIREDQTVVIYAPTWRDDLASSYASAATVQHLDLAVAADRLGEDHVILMRGHRFNPRSRSGSSRIIDVSSYPEVNDLLLASDVAVLDYSSMRFDFALTRRPMIFLVPDLETYAGSARGFLFPFEESAPGPFVTTTEEVVARVLDLDGVRRDHADDYQRFHERFNYLQDGRSTEVAVAAFFDPPHED